ncbi:MAG: porin family protein [Gemmatimonadaceae bacterium]
MKRSIVFTGMLMCTVGANVTAQSSPVQVGVDFGAVIASVVGDGDENTDSHKAPYAGASLVVHKTGARFGFQTGLYLVPKGSTSKDTDFSAKLSLNYVEIPLLLRVAFPLQGSKVVPALLLGGSVGIKTSCNATFEAGVVSTKLDCEDSSFEGDLKVKTIDFGVSGGVEVAIPVGTRFFLAPTVRYTRGLIDIADTSDKQHAKNTAFQIGAMFRIQM